MELKSKCILLYSRPYRMVDEKTGQVNEGISMQYLTSDNLNPVSDKDSKGIKSAKDSLPLAFAEKITEVPALYELSFSMSVNAQGKPQMKVTDVNFISRYPLK